MENGPDGFDYRLRGQSARRQLAARRAFRGGQPIAELRAVADGRGVEVEALVHPAGGGDAPPLRPDPIRFGGEREALVFLDDAADAFVVLGCDVERE